MPDTEPSDTVWSDSAGVLLVENTGVDRPLDWRLEPLLRLGSPSDPDQSFFDLDHSSVGFGPDGKIYVLDKGNYRVQVYDQAGNLLATMGRKGFAMGELRNPILMRVEIDGEVRVLDFAKQSWTRFAPDGTPLDGEPLHDMMSMGWQSEWTDAGFVTSTHRNHRAATDSLFDGVLLVRDGDSTHLAELGRPRGEETLYEECLMWIALPPVFTPELTWSAAGDRIVISQTVPYELDVFEGPSLVMKIRRYIEPRTVGRAEAVASQRGRWKSERPDGQKCEFDIERMIDVRGFETQLPAISDVSVDPDGRVWARRGRMRWDEATSVDVFSREGEYLGTLPAGTPVPSTFDPHGRPVMIETDELGVEYVVLYQVLAN